MNCEAPGAVAILPINNNQEIYFVRQYRKALDIELIEIPAGKLEKNEIPSDCALRELQEEIGFSTNKLTLIGDFCSSPGFTNEIIYIYKAQDLIVSKLTADDDEFINVVMYSINDTIEMLNNGLKKMQKLLCSMFRIKTIIE